MRAFVSVDMEGMPFIVSVEHLTPKGKLYSEARRITTRVVKVVAEALREEGFEEVVVADSHGPMVNVLPEELPDHVQLVRGFPRPLSMVCGAEGCTAALFLGYHAKHGTPRSAFDHTYSGSVIRRVLVNGVEASEYLLNAYVLGELGVPVVLVAGEERLLEDDVARFTPWAERVVLKRSYGRYSSVSPSMKRIEESLRSSVSRAVAKLRGGEAKPLVADTPIELTISFASTGYADVAELLPCCKRVDGFTVKLSALNMREAYKLMELLVIAGVGLRHITS